MEPQDPHEREPSWKFIALLSALARVRSIEGFILVVLLVLIYVTLYGIVLTTYGITRIVVLFGTWLVQAIRSYRWRQ